MRLKQGFSKQLPTPIAVVGLGKSGQSALRLLKMLGYASQDICTFDESAAAILSYLHFQDGEVLMHQQKPQTLVVSPGVPLQLDWIKKVKSSGGCITSELALAYDQLTNERCIAVTGSFGKSTTVSLLGVAAQNESQHNFVGGNLGLPLADYAVKVLSGGTKADWVVLELSSYQLENFENLRCELSAITSLSPNHLNRYDSLEHYYLTKWSLLDHTERLCILNRKGHDLTSFASTHAPPNPSLQIQWCDPGVLELQNLNLGENNLIGDHNFDNLNMAACLGAAAGWSTNSLKAMRQFRGLAHRLEALPSRKEIFFINDSKSTTIESVMTALSATTKKFPQAPQIFLLLGGRDKNLPWQALNFSAYGSRVTPVFFGEVASHAKKLSGLSGDVFENLSAALLHLRQTARPKDVVLLSPGGTSWDEFKSFEHRGEFFKTQVESLWSN